MMDELARTRREGCLQRLRALQALVEQSKADGLLLVAGIDGDYDAATAQVLSYLVEGKSGHHVLETFATEPLFEDVIFLVKAKSFKCYCQGEAYEKLVDLFARGLERSELFKPSEAEEQDTDALEEYKVGSFVQMVKGMGVVGLPCKSPLQIESWPLIQSYGIEGVGKSGFFTMNFETLSLSEEISSLFPKIDGQAFVDIVRTSVPMFLKHFEDVTAVLDRECLSGFKDLDEADVIEPFEDYYSCRNIRAGSEVQEKDAPLFRPRLLAGKHTSECGTRETFQSRPIVDDSENATPSLHFTLELADPKTPMAFARTYFLSCGRLREGGLYPSDEDLYEIDDFQEILNQWTPSDVVYLSQTYTCLIDAGRAAMAYFSANPKARLQEVEDSAKDALASALATRALPEPASTTFQLEEVDLAGNVLPARVGSTHLKRFKLVAHGLRSQAEVKDKDAPVLLGSMAYGETFIDCDCSEGPKYEVLTSGVPLMQSWPVVTAERIIQGYMSKMLRKISQDSMVSSGSARNEVTGTLGDLVIDGSEEVTILVENEYMSSVRGEIYTFEKGFVFFSPNVLPVVVNLEKDVRSFTRYVRDQKNIMTSAVLLFEVEDAALTGFEGSQGGARANILGLALSTLEPSACRYFNQRVWPKWMGILSSGGMKVATESVFSLQVQDLHDYTASARTKIYPSLVLPDGKCKTLASHLNAMVAPKEARGRAVSIEEETSVPLVLIVGIPGSGHEALVGLLRKAAHQDRDWRLAKRSSSSLIDAGGPEAVEAMEKAISAVCSNGKGKGETKKKVGVLVPCPGYQSLSFYLSILSRTAHFKSGFCHLSATLACVHTENLVIDGRGLYCKGVFEQLSEDYVNTVVIFGDEDRAPNLRKVLRARLPGARLVASRKVTGDALVGPSLEIPRDFRELSPSSASVHEKVFARTACTLLEDEEALKRVFQEELEASRATLAAAPALEDDSASGRGSRRALLWFKVLFACAKTGARKEICVLGQRVRISASEEEAICLASGRPAEEVEWILVGRGLTKAYARDLIQRCVQPPLPERKLREVNDLRASEKQTIQKEHILDPLPEGYRFTGTNYVDCFGEHTAFHPDFDKHATTYLEKENEDIARTNKEIASRNSSLVDFEVLDLVSTLIAS